MTLTLPSLTGKKIRTKVTDCNEVERGEVQIPIGHTAVIGHLLDVDEGEEMYAVLWDNNAEGLNMGWCLWSRSELFADAEFIA